MVAGASMMRFASQCRPDEGGLFLGSGPHRERRAAAIPAPRDRSVGAAAIAHCPQLLCLEEPIPTVGHLLEAALDPCHENVWAARIATFRPEAARATGRWKLFQRELSRMVRRNWIAETVLGARTPQSRMQAEGGSRL